MVPAPRRAPPRPARRVASPASAPTLRHWLTPTALALAPSQQPTRLARTTRPVRILGCRQDMGRASTFGSQRQSVAREATGRPLPTRTAMLAQSQPRRRDATEPHPSTCGMASLGTVPIMATPPPSPGTAAMVLEHTIPPAQPVVTAITSKRRGTLDGTSRQALTTIP